MTNNPRQLFLNILQKEVVQANKLLQLLAEEKEILSGNDPKEIEKIVEKKLVLINTAQQLTKERDAFLKELKLPTGKQGVEECLKRYASKDEETKNLWNSLQGLARQCYELNNDNARITDMHKHFTDKALAILNGQPAKPQELYNAKGVKQTSNISTKLKKHYTI